jgi:cell division protein FtsB
MTKGTTTPTLGAAIYFSLAALLGGYFTFAAVQGNHGLFQRVQIEAELAQTRATRDRLATELARIENRTRRLSDDFLDLDLLDERAREVLGMMRGDEIILR